jgi:hypothetical protein
MVKHIFLLVSFPSLVKNRPWAERLGITPKIHKSRQGTGENAELAVMGRKTGKGFAKNYPIRCY